MMVMQGLVAAAALVGLGYFALWAAARPETRPGLAGFGRVIGIVLFVVAGLALLVHAAAIPMQMAGRFGGRHARRLLPWQDGHGERKHDWHDGTLERLLDSEQFEDRTWELMEEFMVEEDYEEVIDGLERRVERIEADLFPE